MNEQLNFLRNWLVASRRVSAVAPSSRSLAALITAAISSDSAPVIELGPGTGVFTRHLIGRGIPEDQLALIESGADFARNLQLEFAGASVHCMNAARIGGIDLFNGTKAGAVVSGLPLLSMPPMQVTRIMKSAFGHLRQGGAFYQFTYGRRCPIHRAILERLGLQASYVGTTLANLPPAAVFRIARSSSASDLA